jgi:hypothetical protein
MKIWTVRRLVCLACAAVALATASAQDQAPQGQQGPPPRPQYLDLVYDEDWSHLKESNAPPDFFDPIKDIVLNDRGWYMSLGGEIRERYDNWHNPLFGFGAAETLNDNLERYLFHADTHLGEHVRIFTELASALEYGKKGGPWYTDKDGLQLHQAFVDFRSSANPRHYTLLRVGRQEIDLGTSHFVSPADFFNCRRAFDGVWMKIGRGSWTWVLEATKPFWVTETGAFVDPLEHFRTSWGGGFFAPNPFTKQGRTAGFFYALDTKNQLWQRGLGRDQRYILGARIDGSQKGFDYAYEALSQFGTFTPVLGPGTSIRAWAVTSETGFTFLKSKHYPRIGVRSNITSGDSGEGSLGTFHPLFPDTAYSGKLGLIGPSNVIDLTPNVRALLTKRIYFLSDWSFFWRQKTSDGIYSPAINTTPVDSGITGFIDFPALPGDRARFVANQISVASQVTIDRHLDFTPGYSYLTAGGFLKDTPPGVAPGKSVGYFWAWLRYKF